jgi:hypothetical protein
MEVEELELAKAAADYEMNLFSWYVGLEGPA